MKFTTAILHKNGTVQKISGTTKWVVQNEFEWYVDEINKTNIVTVYEGFTTDFGSIPFFITWLFNPTEWIAFVLHDYLYTYQLIEGEAINRIDADQVLYKALQVEGCSIWKSTAIYLGVRIGGWLHWKK